MTQPWLIFNRGSGRYFIYQKSSLNYCIGRALADRSEREAECETENRCALQVMPADASGRRRRLEAPARGRLVHRKRGFTDKVKEVTAYAPASIGNVGPGFDVLGLAITNLGDRVKARKKRGPGVELISIEGDGGRLPLEPGENTATLAASKVLERIGAAEGLNIEIIKGVPFPSGLGSSAASAVAGGFAANYMFGEALGTDELLFLCTEAEAEVSGGFFADNTAAALFGGAVVTRIVDGRIISIPMPGPADAVIIMAQPDIPMPTRESRAVLPGSVSLEDFVANMGAAAAITAALCRKDTKLFGESIDDRVVEPARSKLIKGFDDVKKAALERGALGCSISGGGASVFAVAESSAPADRIGEAMKKAFAAHGAAASIHICSIDRQGARILR